MLHFALHVYLQFVTAVEEIYFRVHLFVLPHNKCYL